MKSKTILLGCVSAVAMSSTATGQSSQPAERATDSAPKLEVVVTGIRGSLERAADIKREASQVMDVITSEDVGKLPDANIAGALQRVTGVQMTGPFSLVQS